MIAAAPDHTMFDSGVSCIVPRMMSADRLWRQMPGAVHDFTAALWPDDADLACRVAMAINRMRSQSADSYFRIARAGKYWGQAMQSAQDWIASGAGVGHAIGFYLSLKSFFDQLLMPGDSALHAHVLGRIAAELRPYYPTTQQCELPV